MEDVVTARHLCFKRRGECRSFALAIAVVRVVVVEAEAGDDATEKYEPDDGVQYQKPKENEQKCP